MIRLDIHLHTNWGSWLKFYLSLNLLLLSTIAYSQTPYFSTLKLERSLQQFETHKIFQDSKGYIWFATNEGLFLHDGIETKRFDTNDSLNNSPVTAIAEDRQSLIWVGHKDGTIQFYNGTYFTNFSPEEGLPLEEISFIHFDDNGVAWFGTQGEGIYFFKGANRKRLYNISTDEGLNDNYTYTSTESATGDLYVGTDYGIAIIDTSLAKVKQTITMRDGLPDNIVRHLEFQNDILWIGMDEGGIARYNIAVNQFLPAPAWSFGRLNNFSLRYNNECWVSTKSSGVIRYTFRDDNGYDQKQFLVKHGLVSPKTSTIFCDRESNIWIGNNFAISISASSPFEFFDQRDDFDHKKIFSFILDSKGRYWAATENGLVRICKIESGGFESKLFVPRIQIAPSAFISLYEDKLGFIWAGTYGYGVFKIDPESMNYIHFTSQNGLPDDNIMHIGGTLTEVWLSTLGGGVSCYNLTNKSFKNYSSKDGLASNYVYSTYIDSLNRVFIAQDGGGVSLIHDEKITTSFLPDSLGLKTVYSVVEDKDGAFWINSSEKGLCMFNQDDFIVFSTTADYKIDNLRSITADNIGNIIVVGNEAVQVYLRDIKTFDIYADESGVSFLDPNLNAVSKDQSGNIWISTNNGLVVYNPKRAQSKTEQPKVLISKKMLFFEPIDSGKTVFNFRQNHISFEFAGFWYQAPQNIRYRYKLQNYDFDWSRPTQSRNVTYSNLPPGKYSFELEVSHKPGVWLSNDLAVYRFTIKPPFYKTWWFISFSLVFIASSILLYIRTRLSKLQKDKELLEKEVKKRTATIQLQKEEIETQRDYVIKQRDQIAKQNKDITSSIQYASRIQNALYPPQEQMQSVLGECFILLRPQEIVSGDFYWATQKNDDILLAVADCTGHGVPGAFMSVLGLSLLSKISNESICCKPEEMLSRLRGEIKIALRQTGKMDEAKDGMDMVLVQFNRKTKILHFSGANNPAFIVRNNELLVLKENRMPIGIYPKEREFVGESVQMMPGDMLYLFSDGYIDQFGGSDYRKFMMKNFKNLLVNISPLPLNEQRDVLNKTMDDWKGDYLQNDDILVVGVKF